MSSQRQADAMQEIVQKILDRNVPPPKRTYIETKYMKIDPIYQRATSRRFSEQIRDTFIPWAAGEPIVNQRNGGKSLYIIDGGHRKLGIQKHRRWWAWVFSGLSMADEAAIYTFLNNTRRPMKALDIFKAALAAKTPYAVEIDAIVNRYGCEIGVGGVHAISCVKTIERIYRSRNGANLLERIMQIITDAWDEDEKQRLEATIFRGLDCFFSKSKCASIPDAELVKKLRDITPERLVRQAKARRIERGGSVSQAAATEILRLFNKKKTKGRINVAFMKDEDN